MHLVPARTSQRRRQASVQVIHGGDPGRRVCDQDEGQGLVEECWMDGLGDLVE